MGEGIKINKSRQSLLSNSVNQTIVMAARDFISFPDEEHLLTYKHQNEFMKQERFALGNINAVKSAIE